MKERRYRVADVCRDECGFTLVELILTIAILAIVTMPILNYFTDAAKHNARSRQKQNATVVAQEVLENFKNAPYSLDDPGVVCSAQPEWSPAATPDADGAYTLTKEQTVDKNSFKVTAKIQPVKAVDKSAASPAPTASTDYKKYVIGTMDRTKDVMVSEHGQTLEAAGLACLNKYNAACAGASVTPNAAVDVKWFKNVLDCTIEVSASKDGTKNPEAYDIITVTYKYSCDESSLSSKRSVLGLNETQLPASALKYEDIVESSSIKVDRLENIYLFYKPLTAKDTICLKTSDSNQITDHANEINLFVIAQSSVMNGASPSPGYTERPLNYKVKLDSNSGQGFRDKTANVYTNLDSGEFLAGDPLVGKVKNTLVHSENINRMADITVTVDSKDGSTTGIVKVTGSKVQN